MKKFKLFIASLAFAVFGVAAVVPAGVSYAIDPLEGACDNGASSEICDSRGEEDGMELIGVIVNLLLFVVGAISTVMIIVGGIMYATSTGDSGRITKAKNTIMYSIVGLVIAFLAYASINWVVKIFA